MKYLAMHSRFFFGMFLFALIGLTTSAFGIQASPTVFLKKGEGRIEIAVGDQTVATYVYLDSAIPRPYFCQVTTLDGIQVTRIHPPDPTVNKDNDDHEKLHPGLWLAFGDLSGNDFWRNKAQVRHVRFNGPFVEQVGLGQFTVINRYEPLDGQGSSICEETCTYSIQPTNSGYFILSKSEFRSDKADFSFGDQEEMGFGLRVNTPLTVKFGLGKILNSDRGENEKGTWGRQANWCAAFGQFAGRCVGAAIMTDPANFRTSWFHSRDYGLIVANPFGKKAMTGPDDKSVQTDVTLVRKNDVFKIGFGINIFSQPEDKKPDLDAAYNTYLTLIKDKK